MNLLITYDVDTTTPAGRKRLRRVARCCLNYGQRVQNSVFECDIPEATYATLRDTLRGIVDPTLDSIRIYRLGRHAAERVEHLGAQTAIDLSGDLII